jgi:hypothetical protein
VSKSSSAIGDLAGILGGPAKAPRPSATAEKPTREKKPTVTVPPATTESAFESQPRLLEQPDERSDRITAILPVSLLSQVETRVAALRRKKKVSVSGYIEAALRELLATGEHDVEALEKHRIKARRTVARIR